MSCICFLAMIHLCVHMISAVVLPFLYVLCDWARCLLILSFLFMKILEIIFLITTSKVMDQRFFTGLCIFLGFGSGRIHQFQVFFLHCWSQIFHSILCWFLSGWTSSRVHLISSMLVLSFPGVFSLLISCTAFVTSLLIIILFSLMDGVMNFSIGFMLPFLKWFLKHFPIVFWISWSSLLIMRSTIELTLPVMLLNFPVVRSLPCSSVL